MPEPGTKSIYTVMEKGVPVLDLFPDQDELKVIELIRVRTPDCQTADGVRAGMPLGQLEQRYGKLIRVERTEDQQREYARFPKAPGWLEIEAGNGEAGAYPKEKRCSSSYRPNATVRSAHRHSPALRTLRVR